MKNPHRPRRPRPREGHLSSPRAASMPPRRCIGLVNRVAEARQARRAARRIHHGYSARTHRAHHQGRQADHPRRAEDRGRATWTSRGSSSSTASERRLRRGPPRLHGEAQARVQGKVKMQKLVCLGPAGCHALQSALRYPDKPIKVTSATRPAAPPTSSRACVAPKLGEKLGPTDHHREQARGRG